MKEQITALEKRITALEVQAQEREELICKMRLGIDEFTEMAKHFAEVCNFEIDLYKSGLRE